jgi:hypothetical protein
VGVVSPELAPPPWLRWTTACGLAETLGMAAAALAALLAITWVGEPHDAASAVTTVVLAVLGGVVEGVAVGAVQFWLLRDWLPALVGRRWIGATVFAAALGWLLGMLPPTIAQWSSSESAGPTSGGGVGPPLWLMPLAGLALGAVMGAGFGAAQMWALRGVVVHPGRWVPANSLGWSLALAVMMTGAALPGAAGSWLPLAALGAATGLLAGLAVGAATGLFLPSLTETAPLPSSAANRLVCWMLRSPAHRLLSGALVELRVVGRRSGRLLILPVQYAAVQDSLVMWPAHPAQKTWWRNFTTTTAVDVVVKGMTRSGGGRLVTPQDLGHGAAAQLYRCRFPRAKLGTGDLLVVVDLDQADRSAARSRSSARTSVE